VNAAGIEIAESGRKVFPAAAPSDLSMQRLLLLASLFIGLPAFAQDAVMLRGNLQHTGVYDATGVPQFSKIKWKFHTAGRVISSPAVTNGMAFVGSTDGNVYAVDLQSGAQKWKFDAKVRVPSSPAVSGGVVYFASYGGWF
jgi:eukaryotic-like serine/threonine-protein kinase